MMTDAFLMRAIPKACLYKPEEENVPPIGRNIPAVWSEQRRLNMSVLNFMSKARIHKSAAIRKTIINRIHAAFTLIITRGADCEVDGKGKEVWIKTGDEPSLHSQRSQQYFRTDRMNEVLQKLKNALRGSGRI